MTNDNDNPWQILHAKYEFFRKQKLITKKLAALDDIQTKQPNLSSVGYLFLFLLNSKDVKAVKNKAAQVIHVIMNQLLIQQKQMIFSHFFDYLKNMPNYAQIAVAQVPILCSLPHPITLLGIASLNYNGYVREEALKRMNSMKVESMAIPYLLKRLNDHVPAIRTLSENILLKNLPKYSIHELILYHDSINYLKHLKHTKDLKIYHKIISYMQSLANRMELLSSIEKYLIKSQLFILEILHDDIKNNPEMIEKILNSKSVLLKRTMINKLEISSFSKAQVEHLLKNKNPTIRQAVLLKLPASQIADYISVIETLLYDCSSNVRISARFLFNQYKQTDFLQYYRSLLKDEKLQNMPGVIMGLAEMSTNEDIPALEKHANHSDRNVRASILLALSRLKGNDYILAVQQSMLDQASSVRKMAFKILMKSPSSYDDMLREYLKTKNMKIKMACLNVLASRKSFEALSDILLAQTYNDEHDVLQINEKIHSWSRKYPHIYTPLTQETFENIKSMLDKIDPERTKYAWIDRYINFSLKQ